MNDYLCTGGAQRPDSDRNCCRPNRDECRNDRRDECRNERRDECRNDRREERLEERREDCPCRRGFVQALQALLRTNLANLIDFQQFAFLTKKFLVGATLVCADTGETSYDNLSEELTATFNRFTPCACDFIDVSGAVFLPNFDCPDTGLTISRLNLCDLLAAVFTVTGEDDAATEENYLRAKQLLRQLLRPHHRDDCPPFPDPCDEDCSRFCRDEHTPGGSVSLLAGDLLLANVTVLGNWDGVLILANDASQRFYLVCSEKAVFIQ